MPRINSGGWKRGDVKIHSGTLDDIPAGWELAADMVDRATVGAGGQYSKGQTFGADVVGTQAKTLSTNQLPNHDHDLLEYYSSTSSSHKCVTVSGSRSTVRAGNVYPEGGNDPHDHGNIDTRQKSIAVIWIRKL